MARMPNYIYGGGGGPGAVNPGPWAAAISSLGQSLFGDQTEIDRRADAASDRAYREASTQKLLFDIEAERTKQEAQQAANDAIMKRFGLGGQPVAPAAAAPAIAAPAGIDPTLFAGEPEAAPIQQTPLAPLAANAPVAPQSFLSKVAEIESGGDPTIRRDDGQTASGAYGFTDETWAAVGGQGHAYEATPEEQAMRANELTRRNAADLERSLGHKPFSTELYAGHNLGHGTAVKVINADPDTPMSALVTPEQLAANPQWMEMTAGEYMQNTMDEFSGIEWDGSLPGSQPQAEFQTASGTPAAPLPQEARIDTGIFTEPDEPLAATPVAAGPEDIKLNQFELEQLMIADDKVKVLGEIMAQRAEDARKLEAEGGGGLFKGTDAQAQGLNLIFDYQQKVIAGTATPEDRAKYLFGIELFQSEPRYEKDKHGGVTQVTPPVPMLPGFVDPYGQQQGGAGDVSTTPAGTTSTTPAGTTSTTGGPEVKQIIPGQPDPLPSDIAGKYGILKGSMPDLEKAWSLYAPGGVIDERVVAESTGKIWRSDGRYARQAVMSAMQGPVRVLTGAAIPKEEKGDWEELFIPDSRDSPEANRAKLERLTLFNVMMQEAIMAGRGWDNDNPLSYAEVVAMRDQAVAQVAEVAPTQGGATEGEQQGQGVDVTAYPDAVKLPGGAMIYSNDGKPIDDPSKEWFEHDGTPYQ